MTEPATLPEITLTLDEDAKDAPQAPAPLLTPPAPAGPPSPPGGGAAIALPLEKLRPLVAVHDAAAAKLEAYLERHDRVRALLREKSVELESLSKEVNALATRHDTGLVAALLGEAPDATSGLAAKRATLAQVHADIAALREEHNGGDFLLQRYRRQVDHARADVLAVLRPLIRDAFAAKVAELEPFFALVGRWYAAMGAAGWGARIDGVWPESGGWRSNTLTLGLSMPTPGELAEDAAGWLEAVLDAAREGRQP